MSKDKINLDLSDTPELAEQFSRLEPGDMVSGTFKACLDESKDGLAILSIKEISIKAPKAKPDGSKSAAVKVFESEAEEAPKEDKSAGQY